MGFNTGQRDNSLVTAHIRHARAATFAGFFLIGALAYVWSTSVSAFRQYLGLIDDAGDLQFGTIAFGIGVGAAAGALLVGKLIDRYGAKRVVGGALVLYPVSIIPLGFVGSEGFALAFGIALGILRGATDTAVNAHGVQVERFYQRPIMSAFHAFYSLGGFVFGMIGSWFAGHYQDSAKAPFLICGIVLFIVAIVIFRYLLDKDDIVHPSSSPMQAKSSIDQGSTVFGASDLRIIILMCGFGLVLLAGMFGENAVGDWGQEYLRREVGTTPAAAGIAISFFTGAQFLARFIGDRLAEWMGAARMVLIFGLIAISGTLVGIFASSAHMGMLAFALFGFGISCIPPLMLSSAGRKDPANAGRNIGIVNGLGFSGVLVAPAALSLVVNAFGIGRLLYIPLVLLGLLTIFGPLLMRERTPRS